MMIDGRCLCGHLTYRARIDPDMVAVCHCSDCQNHSGTAYGVVVAMVGDFELLSGQMKTWTKTADSGNRRDLTFCPECGTRIYAANSDGSPGFVGLRVGTVTQRAALKPRMQVWCESALPWVEDLTDLPRFPKGPTGV